VLDGLRADGIVLVNSTRDIAELPLGGRPGFVVPATELALELVGRPMPNAALLGGFSAISGRVSLASVCAAIRDRFPAAVAEANVAAATRAFEIVQEYQHA
jgi:pyruvate ferredoxin oxidoreductase gamma subunit